MSLPVMRMPAVKFRFLSLLLMTAISSPAAAAVGATGPVYIENISIIEQAVLGHRAGNLELKIKDGFTLPAGLTCSNVYITTLEADDPKKRLFALLTAAKMTQQPLLLHISDDPQHAAIPGRCSLVAATVL
ncbi:hypothetical protein [Janthinobacterium sp.]|uniref:hypothetical protein n=1 Tax=Janthinobacterium sp. TaxID=1871054 RepID=UPI00261625C6|nr:hypothetical protein [Janthinobacterium sp.]